MSAYLVDESRLIAACTAYMNLYAYQRMYPSREEAGFLARILSKNNNDVHRSGHYLARIMWNLNNQAMKARYGDKYVGTIRHIKPRINQEYATFLNKPIHLYKFMCCLAYQCSEFRDEPPLLRGLNSACHSMAASIISKLPEYEAAKWG